MGWSEPAPIPVWMEMRRVGLAPEENIPLRCGFHSSLKIWRTEPLQPRQRLPSPAPSSPSHLSPPSAATAAASSGPSSRPQDGGTALLRRTSLLPPRSWASAALPCPLLERPRPWASVRGGQACPRLRRPAAARARPGRGGRWGEEQGPPDLAATPVLPVAHPRAARGAAAAAHGGPSRAAHGAAAGGRPGRPWRREEEVAG